MTNNLGSLSGTQIMKWAVFGMAVFILCGAIFHDSPSQSPKEKLAMQIDGKNYTCAQGAK